ncbi:hypothetical protein NDU88_003523 [Pleurodeles waltl]|uniref:Uncharacterized protein n=1 Tax=Pleurodeles waltl TaxID=8319 RepID=A0AAV7TP98_PLEWA|nr:hypothetical protein NDU88_003523 [Pleurodeles waltl]
MRVVDESRPERESDRETRRTEVAEVTQNAVAGEDAEQRREATQSIAKDSHRTTLPATFLVEHGCRMYWFVYATTAGDWGVER